jgi:hypothetical protein
MSLKKQNGGGVFKLTRDLSSNNKELARNYLTNPGKRPELIKKINIVLKQNGFNESVNDTETRISPRVSNIITQKVARDCQTKDKTRRNLAAKLQREFLAYLKQDLDESGKPKPSTARVQSGQPSTARVQSGIPYTGFNGTTTTRTTSTGTTSFPAENKELEDAEKAARDANTRLEQIKAKRRAEAELAKQVAAQAAQTENQHQRIEIIHTKLETLQPMVTEAIQDLLSGNAGDDIKQKIIEMFTALRELSKDIDPGTAKAANIPPNTISNIANQVKHVVSQISTGTSPEKITNELRTVETQLNDVSTHVEEAEENLAEKQKKLEEEATAIKQENEKLRAAQEKAEAAAKAAEAAAKQAQEEKEKAEATAKAAEAAAANNRAAKTTSNAARAASNARVKELEEELAKLKETHATELDKIHSDLNSLPYVPPELKDAYNNIQAAKTASEKELQNLPTNAQKTTNTVVLENAREEANLLEAFSNVAAQAKSRNQAGKNSAESLAKLMTNATKAADTAAKIANINTQILMEHKTAVNTSGKNQYVVAVNVSKGQNTNKPTNKTSSSFNLTNPASEEEPANPSNTTPRTNTTQSENATPSANTSSSIRFDTHQEPTTQSGEQETSPVLPVNEPPAENKSSAKPNMAVALVIPVKSDKTKSTNTNPEIPELKITEATNESENPSPNQLTPAAASANNKKGEQVALGIPNEAKPTTSANMNVALVKPESKEEFEKAKITPLSESEEVEGQEEVKEKKEEANREKKQVMLALAPNMAETSQLPKLETSGSGEYLEILPNNSNNNPQQLPKLETPGSGEYFDVGTGENEPATGGRKMTWKSVKRYFTPKKNAKHHTTKKTIKNK